VPRLVTALFLAAVFGVPLGQAAWELAAGERVVALDVFGPVREDRLREYERALRESSFIHRRITPWYQWLLLRGLGRGNEKAIVGREGWLFHSDELDFVHGPSVGGAASAAVAGILAFREALAARGTELVLVPVPTKSTVETAQLAGEGTERARNPGAAAALAALRDEGLRVVDLEPVLARRAPKERYLSRDTHWTPETMRAAAREIADHLRPLVPATAEAKRWSRRPVAARGLGDVARMLRLPARHRVFEPLEVALEQVVDERGELFAPDPTAEVLLFGDSYTRVFSDPALGLGDHAGLAEQLAAELGIALDVIAIPAGSARAVREAFARRSGATARKSLVIWEVALSQFGGDPDRWAPLPLPPLDEPEGIAAEAIRDGPSGKSSEEASDPERARVLAEVVETSRVPPGFGYDLCLLVYEYRVLAVEEGDPGEVVWVAHVGVREFEETRFARMDRGTRLRMTLEPIGRFYDLEATSWIDDTGAGKVIWYAVESERAD